LPDVVAFGWWLLGFGENQEVVEPQRLCKEFQSTKPHSRQVRLNLSDRMNFSLVADKKCSGIP